MNFLIDAQLPPALARWIESQGHSALHVYDVGWETTDDPLLWERARSEHAVIVSKDEDFVDHWLLSAQPEIEIARAMGEDDGQRFIKGPDKFTSH